jgi:hypothetical protein
MINYDVVVGVGCSWMNGDAINDENGRAYTPFHKNVHTPAIFLSKKLNCDEINRARTGASNEGIFRRIYEWVETNTIYKKPFFMIGLSGTSRYPVWTEYGIRKQWLDLHPAFVGKGGMREGAGGMEKLNKRVTNNIGKSKDLRFWQEYYMKWIYNEEKESEKLGKNVVMLHYYLKGNNVDYLLHNSLEDSIPAEVKNKINYLSFPVGDHRYQYLRWQMVNVDNEKFECMENGKQKYRSPTPPYGKRFCHGHPSPTANKELAELYYLRLLEGH